MNRLNKCMMRRNENGQVLPLTLVGVALACAIMFVMVNTGNRVTEKMRVSNIADSAALSAATVTAQQFNSMAYLNRAMIANHIGAGHMTAYISWIRYVDEAMDRLEDIGNFIPYVNVATDVLEQLADLARTLSEPYGAAYLLVVDSFNGVFAGVQVEMAAAIPLLVPTVMQEVVSESDATVKLNTQALGDFHAPETALIAPGIAYQTIRLASFARSYAVRDLNREIFNTVEASYGKSSQKYRGSMSNKWLTDREWDLFMIKKTFNNSHTLNGLSLEWCSEDKLKIRDTTTFTLHTVASGDACASELYSNYRGIYGFSGLTNQENKHQALHIMAATSKSFDDIYSREGFGFEDKISTSAVTGLAIAQVEFVRPLNINLFKAIEEDEFANLYNPFWRARLVGSSLSDVTKITQTASTWRDGL